MEIVKQLESACKVSLAPPNMVTRIERQQSEEVLLAFRRSKSPYKICRDILEKSEVDFVQFQAATTLKEAVVREWNVLDHETKLSLQQFVLNYISNKTNITGFVREGLCIVLAVMLKRSSLDNDDFSHRIAFYQHLASMVSSGNCTLGQTACSILSAVCTEFSASDKSTNVGLTWDHHVKCKKSFEEHDLIQIFQLILQVLRFIESSFETGMSGENISLCEKVVVIAEQILSWQFSPNTYFRNRNLFLDSTIKHSFKPTKKWAAIVFDPNLLQLFFKLHMKVRNHDSICHGSINCLSQLASLNGPVFEELTQATMYLTNFIQGFLHAFSEGKLQQLEVLGVANIFQNLTEAHKIQIWAMLPREQNLFFSFLHLVTRITCMLTVEAVNKEKEDLVDESEMLTEAYEIMLDAIMSLVQGMDEEDKKSFAATCSAPIIDSFVHCHLSSPDGIRKSSADDTDDEIDELDENDIDKFACQLMLVGGLARLACHTVLPMLCKLIEDRTSKLDNQICQLVEQNVVDVNAAVKNLFFDMFEDLHWLVLLSGHIMADDCDGETALIPSEVIKCSISQKSKIDEIITLQVLGSPTKKICEISGAENSTDYVIRMVSSIIKLAEVETQTLKTTSVSMWSPQMSQDIMWFFKTWANSYLLYDEEYYEEFSPIFSRSFGRNSDGAKWLIGFITSKIINTFTVWSSEVDLLLETCDLLHILVDHDHRCSLLVECGDFWSFCKQFCGNVAPFDSLPSYIKQKIMSSIVLVGSTKMNLYKDDYWKETLEPLKFHYKESVSKEWFIKVALEDKTRQSISSFLILVQGVAIASRPNNSSILFTYLSSILEDCPNLLNIYHNFEDLTVTILELYVEVAHKQICYLKKSQCTQFYEWSMQLLQIYRKHNLTKRSFDDEDSLQDITLVIELLTHLMSKDFIDLEEPEIGSNSAMVGSGADGDYILAVDVVLYGLSITLPFVTSQLLLYPSFCSQYYKLVTFLCELFPEKIEKLPEEMHQFFIQSLQVGLSLYGPDNCKLCLEAVEGLASHCIKIKDKHSSLHGNIPSFVRLVFDSLIVHSGDMELLRPAGETFYVLLCYQSQLVIEMFHQIVESQPDPSHKQRLGHAFQQLIPSTSDLVFDRSHRTTFLKILESVIFSIRGILCVK